MDEFTWSQIGFAVGVSATLIATMLSVAVFVVGRIDAKKKQNEEAAGRDLTNAVELRRLGHAEDVSGDDLLLKIIDLKDAEIKRLEARNERTEKENQLARPTVIMLRHKLGELDKKLHSLLIQPCPDEVANILNERMGEAKVLAAELRDLLP